MACPEGKPGTHESRVVPRFLSSAGQPFPTAKSGRRKMLILCFMIAGYVVLGGVIVFLVFRLTRAKEDLLMARRHASHARARHETARQAAEAAEERCRQLLGHVETSLAQTGQALEVAGQIELVSQQIHGLIDYITHPLDAPQPQRAVRRRGRHALPDSAAVPAITSNEQPEFTS